MKLLSLVLLISFSFISSANSSLPNNRHIAIEGLAEINAIPDMAVIMFEISKNNQTSLGAKQEIDSIVTNFLGGVAKFGINESDISASGISITQNFTYVENEPKPDGFIASRNLEVTLKNIKKLSSFVDFALKSEINELRRIELASSKSDILKKKVNELAIENAKDKGESLAKAFGANLGKIYSINALNEDSNYGYGSKGKIVEHFNMITVNKPNAYLQENITFSASISVVFDLDVK
jgi:uncharacterized protein YggE